MPAGRPTKLNAEVAEKICRLIRAGNFAETAACAAGIDRDTLRRWLKRGATEKRGPYRDLALSLDEAASVAEGRAVALIAKAGETQWQAAAWFLERKHPERWGRTSAGAVQPDKKRGEAQVKPGSTHNYYAPHPGLAGLKDGDGG